MRVAKLAFIGALLFCSTALAQFGGRQGDVVLYLLTAKGSGEFQVLPAGTTNSAAASAAFRIIPLDSVSAVASPPFPIFRQVFYEVDDEIFQFVTDPEAAIGLHRVFLKTTKVFVVHGSDNTFGSFVTSFPTYASFPGDLDVEGEIVLEDLQFLAWTPMKWPILAVVDKRGPIGDPNVSGLEWFFGNAVGIKVPFLVPWTPLRRSSGAGWQQGIDLKMLDTDPSVGITARLLRLRPGRRTPILRMGGHTHLFVLQGQMELLPAGSGAVPLVRNDYAFLPPGYAFRLSNPKPYDGPD
ncbi:MAG: hypothetical protein HY313_08010 [Acidobacteria bacterium]|nr:hypothetical protein [Acidobacteriota bacterium]